ncbi:MAG: sulfatase family protein [Armatimonadota bacterium]|jgi:arylsulfatase A
MSRPNIVYIMADDMGFGDPGCYGATKIPTPNMDRLAREGMRFTDAHSASAVCTPSRYAALTGRYCWRTRLQSGVMWGYSPPLIDDDRPTVATMLRDTGYATAAVGKWHLGLGWNWREPMPDDPVAIRTEFGHNIDHERPLTHSPNDSGFDYFFGIPASLDMQPYCFVENREPVGIPSVEKDRYNPQQREGLMVPGWEDDQVDVMHAQKACEFIERSAGADSPFFLYLTPSVPHRPCVPPEFMEGASQAGLRGDCVALYDWVVGEVLDTLDRQGIADETLVLVTSDNGARATDYFGNDWGHKSCGDWRGQKADIWEGGHREPLLARWPGRVAPGSVCDETVGLIDLMATCADVAGCGIPEGGAPDSVSILPALEGEELREPLHEATVHHSLSGMFAIRQGEWKAVFGLGSGGFTDPREVAPEAGGPEGQLYHMIDDPRETTNLWQKEPVVVRRLSNLLNTWRVEGRSVNR